MPHHPAGVAEETAERNRRGGGAESSRASTLQSFRAEVVRCRVRGTPSARARELEFCRTRGAPGHTMAHSGTDHTDEPHNQFSSVQLLHKQEEKQQTTIRKPVTIECAPELN